MKKPEEVGKGARTINRKKKGIHADTVKFVDIAIQWNDRNPMQTQITLANFANILAKKQHFFLRILNQ